jgi:hypothetical protein
MGTVYHTQLSGTAPGSKRTREAKESRRPAPRVYVCLDCRRSDVTLMTRSDGRKRCPEHRRAFEAGR